MPDKADKPRQCLIKEQTIDDFLGEMEGNLVFKFVKTSDHPTALTQLIVIGDILPCGNFHIQFDSEGNCVSVGESLGSAANALKKEFDTVQARRKAFDAEYVQIEEERKKREARS